MLVSHSREDGVNALMLLDPTTSAALLLTRCRLAAKKPRPDPLQQLIAHRAIGVEPLLAAAFDRGRVGGRPVLDLGGERARELERLVMRFRRRA